jgi:hypothetical protein
MDDRRKHQRLGSVSDRRFIIKYEDKDVVLGEVKNFSRSGISFDSKEKLDEGKELRVDLHISGLNQKVPANMQIIWSKPSADGYTYGVRFTNISPENRYEILDLLYLDWRSQIK